ncbi:stress response protein NST1-like [Gossypium arboreum]|uniref:stress response protein NST1-like n=1 Tax=Gossypium arboreum TaxID=29729 RepID=UPI0008190BDA|nr:stress response protein NST1-like [Gossypium arboreum]
MEEVRPMEEYLQVIPSELDIMKQEFKRKNLKLEKKIEKLEEEKMYLSLDVDLQKKEVEKVRKEKRKVEEDRDDLKEDYKKAQWQKEVQEKKARAEYWEKKFQEMRSQNLTLEKENKGLKTKLEAQEDCFKEELHQVKGQVRDKDYIIGEAIAQIREIAEYVRDLAVRADASSMMYESASDKGRELALLLDKVRTLGVGAKAYM